MIQNKEKKSKVLVVCDKCKKKYFISKVKVLEKKDIEVKGIKVDLIYYKCPECNEVFIVGILNSTAKTFLNKQKIEGEKISQQYRRGKQPNKDLMESYEIAKNNNISYQKTLIAELQDKIPLTGL